MRNRDFGIENLIALLMGIAIFLIGFFGIGLLLWLLWTWVFPQIWPTGPTALISPGYWLFMGMWFLASVVGRMLFGGKK